MNISLDTPQQIIIRDATHIDATLRPTVYDTCEVGEIVFHIKGLFILKAENRNRLYTESHRARDEDSSGKIGSILYVNSEGEMSENVMNVSIDDPDTSTCRICDEEIETYSDIFHISAPVVDINSSEIHGSCFLRVLEWVEQGWEDHTNEILVKSVNNHRSDEA